MPVINFTVKALNAIKAPQDKDQEEYWDSSTPGFGLRISRGGKKVWVVRYKIRDSREMDRQTLGRFESMGLADAKIGAREYLDAASKGINLKNVRLQKIEKDSRLKKEATKTFGWLVEKYLSDRDVLKKRSLREEQRILSREVLSFWDSPNQGWRNLLLGDIKREQVDNLLERTLQRTQAEGGKGVHANRVFSIIRRVFNFAIEKHDMDTSPCFKMKRPLKEEESRERVLSFQDIRELWRELEIDANGKTNQAISSIFRLMLLTAQRGAEIRSMAWNEFDLERGIWTLPKEKTKNRKSHVLPLSRQALEIIQAQESNREISPWVFPSYRNKEKHVGHIQKAIQRIRSRAGVSYVGHDFRRTAASHMAAIGIPHHIIKKILNHSESNDITAVYNRYQYESEKRAALQQWADHLEKIVAGADSQVIPLRDSFAVVLNLK